MYRNIEREIRFRGGKQTCMGYTAQQAGMQVAHINLIVTYFKAATSNAPPKAKPSASNCLATSNDTALLLPYQISMCRTVETHVIHDAETHSSATPTSTPSSSPSAPSEVQQCVLSFCQHICLPKAHFRQKRKFLREYKRFESHILHLKCASPKSAVTIVSV